MVFWSRRFDRLPPLTQLALLDSSPFTASECADCPSRAVSHQGGKLAGDVVDESQPSWYRVKTVGA
jgi:hypothetical protein